MSLPSTITLVNSSTSEVTVIEALVCSGARCSWQEEMEEGRGRAWPRVYVPHSHMRRATVTCSLLVNATTLSMTF